MIIESGMSAHGVVETLAENDSQMASNVDVVGMTMAQGFCGACATNEITRAVRLEAPIGDVEAILGQAWYTAISPSVYSQQSGR